jgi:glycosyltransferase involved in cell wall biosynthesis
MSKEHAQTIADGFGRTQFFNILLGSDLSNYNDPYRIGIFSKRFSDGRKNEKWLLRLAKEIELPDVEFTFVGSGWGDVALKLNALGVKTKRFDGEQHQYPEYSDFPSIYKSVDLFLSPSFDEGSMGSLDAFILGIDMLISRHGFHCELNLKEENYLDNYDDFKLKIENRLETFRTRRNEAKKWNWGRTAETLLSHWQSLEQKGENRQRAIGSSANGRLNWKVKKRYLSRSIYRLVKINFVERVSNRIKRIFN